MASVSTPFLSQISLFFVIVNNNEYNISKVLSNLINFLFFVILNNIIMNLNTSIYFIGYISCDNVS